MYDKEWPERKIYWIYYSTFLGVKPAILKQILFITDLKLAITLKEILQSFQFKL